MQYLFAFANIVGIWVGTCAGVSGRNQQAAANLVGNTFVVGKVYANDYALRFVSWESGFFNLRSYKSDFQVRHQQEVFYPAIVGAGLPEKIGGRHSLSFISDSYCGAI